MSFTSHSHGSNLGTGNCLSPPILKMNKNNIKLTQIKPGLLMLEEADYIEHCNIFVFTHQDSCLIFDCGVGLIEPRKYLVDMGLRHFIVVPTHSHFDHIGSLNSFHADEIFLHQKILQQIIDKQFALKYMQGSDFKSKNDYEKVKEIFKNISILGWMKLPSIITFGNYSFEAINLPGHTDDSCVYYDQKTKILITGDVMYDGKLFFEYSDCRVYQDSLKKLLGLDIDLALTGHNEILNNAQFKKILLKQLKWLEES